MGATQVSKLRDKLYKTGQRAEISPGIGTAVEIIGKVGIKRRGVKGIPGK